MYVDIGRILGGLFTKETISDLRLLEKRFETLCDFSNLTTENNLSMANEVADIIGNAFIKIHYFNEDEKDAFQSAIICVIGNFKFDPNRNKEERVEQDVEQGWGKLATYVWHLLKSKLIDSSKQIGKQTETAGIRNVPDKLLKTDDDSDEPFVKRLKRACENDENEYAALDIPYEEDYLGILENECVLHEMAMMIIDFWKKGGKKTNPTRYNYFKMWYSEKTIYLLLSEKIYMNENNIQMMCKALSYGYLSYFMDKDFETKENQTWNALISSRPKETISYELNGKSIMVLVDWNRDGWLNALIPIGYVKKQTSKAPAASTISTSRDSYLKELHKILERS